VAHGGQPNTAHGAGALGILQGRSEWSKVAPSASIPAAGNRQWLQISDHFRVSPRLRSSGCRILLRDWLHRYSLEGNISINARPFQSKSPAAPILLSHRIPISGAPARPDRGCAVFMRMAAVAMASAISGRPAAGYETMSYSNARITEVMNCSKRMLGSPVLADGKGMICTRSRKALGNCESSRKQADREPDEHQTGKEPVRARRVLLARCLGGKGQRPRNHMTRVMRGRANKADAEGLPRSHKRGGSFTFS